MSTAARADGLPASSGFSSSIRRTHRSGFRPCRTGSAVSRRAASVPSGVSPVTPGSGAAHP